MKKLEKPEPVNPYVVRKIGDVFAAEKPKNIVVARGSYKAAEGPRLYEIMAKIYAEAWKICDNVDGFDSEEWGWENNRKNKDFIKAFGRQHDMGIFASTCLCCDGQDSTDRFPAAIEALYDHVGKNVYVMTLEQSLTGPNLELTKSRIARVLPRPEWDLSDALIY